MILLTDEEKRPFVKTRAVLYGAITVTEEHWDIDGLLEAQLKKAGEWGIEPCQEHYTGGGVCSKRECPKCWQDLLDEVK